jgi:adenine C2-methylase RlmN of 23S rRNA A2503 and tRNA A37
VHLDAGRLRGGLHLLRSGVAGLKRRLGAEEITAVLLAAPRRGEALRNVVYMGMGEPLLAEATARSIRRSPRHRPLRGA